MRQKIFMISMLFALPFLLMDNNVKGVEAMVNAKISNDVYLGFAFDTPKGTTYIFKEYIELEQYKNKAAAIEPEFLGYLSEALAEYDKKFFLKNNLVISLIDTGSGSVRYEFRGTSADNGILQVDINRLAPFVQTMDYRLVGMMLSVDKGIEFDKVNIVLHTKEANRF